MGFYNYSIGPIGPIGVSSLQKYIQYNVSVNCAVITAML